jgi:putative molybdopterin biosynthesis protein
MQQQQFLDVIDRDEAERRFRGVLDLRPLPAESIPLSVALGRVLAANVIAPVDVPGFDRANVDGFAVRAQDTFGAAEERPVRLLLSAEVLATGIVPTSAIQSRTATLIATGAVVPRGADTVVMVEYTDVDGPNLLLRRPAAPGANITFAGTDISRGETVLRKGERLTARETGVLAAVGLAEVSVVRRPRVAIISTGDEIIAPGEPLRPGLIYDSNAVILADAVRELGGEPVHFGIVPDNEALLLATIERALECDIVLLSGGTSKGGGDISYRVVGRLGEPGIVAHGIALKPGKPLCLAAIRRERTIPLAILPGFPTSAVFTFREFIAPVIRALAGRAEEADAVVKARLPLRVNSERGRTEYLLVSLVATSPLAPEPPPLAYAAYPMGKDSGSVTTFSRADGFIKIPRQREYLEAGDIVDVHLLARDLRPADLVVIGSHCVGLDFLLGKLHEQGIRSKFLAVGSTGGLTAARRGECDLAGIHLFDPVTNTYNQPFLSAGQRLLAGYRRLQGVVFRRGDSRFEGYDLAEAVHNALADPTCILVNRNRGSGTRILIDRLLGEARPSGYLTEARSHNAVAAAVAQGRADWGVAIATVARETGLGFIPLQEEHYDWVVPADRWDSPAVRAFRALLEDPEVRSALANMGLMLAIRAEGTESAKE